RLSVPVAEDLGSGHLGTHENPLTELEPSVVATMADGADLCCFSGDKLLGGPQAGIIVGRSDLVERVRKHPLMRALRVDKMTYAALEATLVEYVAGRAADTVPVQRMLSASADAIRKRAMALATKLSSMGGWSAQLIEGSSAVGGGSAPGVELPTCLVAIGNSGLTPDALESRRGGSAPPGIARAD